MFRVLGIIALIAIALLTLGIVIRILAFLLWIGLIVLIVAAIAFLVGRLSGHRRI